MPRPRTATAILEARGAFKKDPQRKRVDPKPSGELCATPPVHLTPEQQRAWRRIVDTAPAGVLMNSDEIMLEMAACLLAEFQTDPNGMLTARITRLEVQLGKFGLSPSDRARIGVSPEDDDEF
jgi:phage terminase small subunit